ncbi:uncharacterized protein LOC103398924 isoform X4 [Cynoglossus semilaevis]|uniref:Uncharacterized LOC103398924 n=1 Tax=Cynoglossus semilaevis TaxID=244447 RepID=A0A3P8WRR7_CYNSE|nr:uncharacterized protein LOC103398924 isoform X4 [Cynoglossus semilaevis]
MRCDEAAENQGCGESLSVTGERRPSVAALQNMLKKVSQSPFHNQYKALVSSTSDCSSSSVNESKNTQEDESFLNVSAASENHQMHVGQNLLKMDNNHELSSPAQNGVNVDLVKTNPFYAYYLESGSKGHLMEDEGMTTGQKEKIGTSTPSPQFQRSHLDYPSELKKIGPVNNCSEPQKEMTSKLMQELYRSSTFAQKKAANGHFHDETQSGLFPAGLHKPQDVSESWKSTNSEHLNIDGVLQVTKAVEFQPTARAKEVDLLNRSSVILPNTLNPSTKEVDLFQTLEPTPGNRIYTSSTNETDLFQTMMSKGPFYDNENKQNLSSGMSFKESRDIFSSSSTNSYDPFPSPIVKNLFHDPSTVEDPFGTTPSKQFDPFQDVSNRTHDIFQPVARTKNNSPLFGATQSNSPLENPFGSTILKGNNASRKTSDETPDIFQPLPSTTHGMDLFQMPSSDASFKTQSWENPLGATTSKQFEPFKDDSSETADIFKPVQTALKPLRPSVLLERPTDKMSDKFPSPDLRAVSLACPPAVQPGSFNIYDNVVMTFPQETKHTILQPTPFSQALNVPSSPDHSPELNHAHTFRRPPKPLPRTRPPRADKPPRPDRPQPERPPKPETTPMAVKPEAVAPKRSPKPAFKPLPKPVIPRKPKTTDLDPHNYVMFEDILLIGQEKCVEDWPEDSPELSVDYKPSGKLRLRRESVKNKVDSDGGSGDDPDVYGTRKKEKKFRMSMLSIRSSRENVPDDMRERKTMTLPSSHKSPKEYFSEGQMAHADNEEGLEYRKKPLKLRVNQLLRRSSTAMSVSHGKTTSDHLPRASKGNDELKGAHGYSPKKASKQKTLDENFVSYDHYVPGEKLKNEFKPRTPTLSCTPPGPQEVVSRSHFTPQQTTEASFVEEDLTGNDVTSPADLYGTEQYDDEIRKPKRSSKLKRLFKPKNNLNPPEAASSDFMSEAAQAEWLAAQKDGTAMVELEDDKEDDGDTDSLMAWWDTVEKWDEVPSDEEDNKDEDEYKSFSILSDKVERGLRLFNQVFTERAEFLWLAIIRLHAIADDISEYHEKAKKVVISGGSTSAVGGAAAIVGLALAPITFGTSLLITAVGVGVATAGGITSASAAISDNRHSLHDRKKIEAVLLEYEGHLLDIGKILHFIDKGLYKLRGHPYLRCGTQHYSSDWETRRTVQIIGQVDKPVMQAVEVADDAVTLVQGLFNGMDNYFLKESRELKKSCKKEIVGEIKTAANKLNDSLVELNAIREQLQEATGHV